MAKVVYTSLKALNPKRKPAGVASKRVIDAEGKATTIHTLNADGPNFGEDLSYVFTQNVRKARPRNAQIAAAAGRVLSRD